MKLSLNLIKHYAIVTYGESNHPLILEQHPHSSFFGLLHQASNMCLFGHSGRRYSPSLGKEHSGTHWIEERVGPSQYGHYKEGKSLCPCQESNLSSTPVQPVASSRHWLSCSWLSMDYYNRWNKLITDSIIVLPFCTHIDFDFIYKKIHIQMIYKLNM
jgi:hypothetical protein